MNLINAKVACVNQYSLSSVGWVVGWLVGSFYDRGYSQRNKKREKERERERERKREKERLLLTTVAITAAINRFGCLLVVWVLWHINLCRSFNAKFCLYIHTYIFNQRFQNEY